MPANFLCMLHHDHCRVAVSKLFPFTLINSGTPLALPNIRPRLYHAYLTPAPTPNPTPTQELYPRIYNVDVKKFVNCRFSMTFWMLAGISLYY